MKVCHFTFPLVGVLLELTMTGEGCLTTANCTTMFLRGVNLDCMPPPQIYGLFVWIIISNDMNFHNYGYALFFTYLSKMISLYILVLTTASIDL